MRNVLRSNNIDPTVLRHEATNVTFDYDSMDKMVDDMDTKGFGLPSPTYSGGEDYLESSPMTEDAEEMANRPFVLQSGKLVMPGSKRGIKRTRSRTVLHVHRSRVAKSSLARLGDGRIVQNIPKKDLICRTTDAKTGQLCGKGFARHEHLKRHVKTHDGEAKFYCPLDLSWDCSKTFGFPNPKEDPKIGPLGRKDNWRDHLKTHLRYSAAGRNKRLTDDGIMWQAIRDQAEKDPDTYGGAEETIQKVRDDLRKKAAEKGQKTVVRPKVECV